MRIYADRPHVVSDDELVEAHEFIEKVRQQHLVI
jgi:hypothetical protein